MRRPAPSLIFLLVLILTSLFLTDLRWKGLSRAEINRRVKHAVESTFSTAVVYPDILGEGPGAWDPDPRYPVGTVNCIIWIDQILAEVYGFGLPDKTPVMDRIRYFNGVVSYGTRKHFLEQRMAYEPEPLLEISLRNYTKELRHETIRLDFGHFKESHRYPCPLDRTERNEFEHEYATREGILEAADKLPAGYYVLFAVAAERYNWMYGALSGPLGLVHGFILQLENAPGRRADGDSIVYHASNVYGRVKKEGLSDLVRRMTPGFHKGYVVYGLDPSWDFERAVRPTDLEREIQACERRAVATLPKQ